MRFGSRSASRWWASLALLAPVILLYAAEYLAGDGRTFTGFIQYDQPYYMANARKFFDGGFHLLYGNPFSPDPQTPAIYFQIHLLVLGAIQAATGCDPGLLYVAFGFFAALICVRVAMALYEQMAGLETRAQWTGLVLFLWGGGILALTGLLFHLCHGSSFRNTLTDLFAFDPGQGWWFLNLGRNLVFPTEAYYHALALGAVLLAMRNRFRASLWLAFLLSLSHPFTGLQFLLILLAWSGLEIGVMKNGAVPFMFPAMLLCLLVFHVAYNLVLLNLFAEHRVLYAQWSVAWNEPISAFIPADCLVGFLAWRSMRTRKLCNDLFSMPANRLLLIWFLISLILVHHDLLSPARQPLHFSRGYVWIPLFLLGVRPALTMLENGFSLRSSPLRVLATGSILLLGLSDNLAWFGLHTAMALAPRWGPAWLSPDGFRLSPADRQLYAWLMKRPLPHSELLTAPDAEARVVYLAMTYTDYRAWYSHFALTPFAIRHREDVNTFFRTGAMPPGWRGRSILVVLSHSLPNGAEATAPIIYKNDSYQVVVIRAAGPATAR